MAKEIAGIAPQRTIPKFAPQTFLAWYEKNRETSGSGRSQVGLFPAIRKAPKGTPIVADGFSCRTQIEEGTGRKAFHMAEFLLMAYEKKGIDLKAGRTSAREVLQNVEVPA